MRYGGAMQAHRGNPWWTSPRLRWGLWLAWLTLVTAVLVGPSLASLVRRQIDTGENEELDLKIFLISKAFHLGAYALLAMLTGWLPAPRWLRVLLLLVLAAHAASTEFLQQFIASRNGTFHDVVIDLVGLLLGVALTWNWWRSPRVVPRVPLVS